MLKFILKNIKNIEKPIIKIMKYGFIFSLSICLLSSILLFTYEIFYALPDLYYIGLSLFKLGLMFYVEFIICGIAVDSIKKQLN